jgi:hypothetical protein
VRIDQLRAATRVKSSLFTAAAVTRNLEMFFEQTLFEQMCRRYRAGLPSDHLMVAHHVPAARAASSTELCS